MPTAYDIKHLPHSQCQIIITGIDDAILLKAEKKALQEFAQELKVPGFRPGHIPEAKIRERVHEGAIRLRTLELAFPEAAQEVVRKESLRLAGPPSANIESASPLKVVITCDVFPEITLGDYKNIQVKVEKTVIQESDVDKAIESLRKRLTEYLPVNREARRGDRVEIDFEGFDEAGAPIPNTSSKNHPLVLGDGMLIPGFEDALLGMKKEEEKSFNLVFPADYHVPDMRKKKVRFSVALRDLQEPKLPELNEEVIEKMMGKKMPLEEFRKEVQRQLEARAQKDNEKAVEDATFEKLISICNVDPPLSLIRSEQETMLKEIKRDILYQRGSFDAYLAHQGKTEESLKESFQKQATERVSLHLILQEIARKESIQVSELEVEEEIQKLAGSLPEEKQSELKKNYARGSKGYILLSYQLQMRKVLELILPHKL